MRKLLKKVQIALGKIRTEPQPGAELVCTLDENQGYVTCLAFDPLSGILACGSTEHTVKLWDIPNGCMLRTLKGHQGAIYGLAFELEGNSFASASYDHTVKLWKAGSGQLLRTLEGHQGAVYGVAFNSQRKILASGSADHTLKLWDTASGGLVRTLEGHQGAVYGVAIDRAGNTLASSSHDHKVKLWDLRKDELQHTFEGHKAPVWSVVFDPQGRMLVSASEDKSLKVWTTSGKLLRTLEGHTGSVDFVTFSFDGRLIASKSKDDTIRIWSSETWETVAVLPEPTLHWVPALAFHPTLPRFASAGSRPNVPVNERSRVIHVWDLDYNSLLERCDEIMPTASAVHHTTGKVVLLGDHSVGKSALGYRLIHDRFEKQESTHGQQFWVFPELGKRRSDGTECEAILWDFAGQTDYRLVHALFVDNADLALVLFDASDLRDPLHGVGFWLKQLQAEKNRCPILLVAAQSDRGASSLTQEELEAFCERNGIQGPITTSALSGEGIAELVKRMKSLIPWEDKPATVTTTTFKRIKDYVLGLKSAESDGKILVTLEELRGRLQATDAAWSFSDAEVTTAVGHLENYGYVRRLRTSKGEQRILLQPERLNNLASSFVLEARRNPKGLGALEEKRLLAGGYPFPELTDLKETERDVLLDSAALLFLEHNVCFRETDPLRMEPYLVFPELINLKKPVEDDQATEEGTAYTVTGPTENVFASLVVLLGYTHTFTRTAQWHNNARYEVGDRLACGFRQEAERDGELDFVLCFGPNVGQSVRTLFQGLFESFLARRNLTVLRYEPVRCLNAHLLDRTVVRQRLKEGKPFAFCNDCGEKLTLPKMEEPIQLSRGEQVDVEAQRHAAEQRTRFEQAVFQLKVFVAAQAIKPPETFISYAWGVPEHERWVEKRLATDLQKAGIAVLLDRWDNAQVGASVPRFVERVLKSDRVVVIGTPKYREKYENGDPMRGFVVAAEGDLIGKRLIGKETEKLSVLPVLLEGTDEVAFPHLLHGRVYADFRDDAAYFTTAFDLILSLYQLPPNRPGVADLRESLRGPEMR